jgi:hypothetical protein
MNLNFEEGCAFYNFTVMKRAFVGICFSTFLFAGGIGRAADAVTLAAQQEAQDNYKRLTATIEEYQTTQAAQQKQISALAAEVSKLRDEIARNSSDNLHKESIRQLSEQVRKVDEARIADNKRIQEALEKLGQTITKIPISTPSKQRSPNVSDSAPGSNGGSTTIKGAGPRASVNGSAEEGFEYEVVSGDRPDVIAGKYQAEKIKVTARDIINANKNVDWTKLKVGQKLFIPKPKSAG